MVNQSDLTYMLYMLEKAYKEEFRFDTRLLKNCIQCFLITDLVTGQKLFKVDPLKDDIAVSYFVGVQKWLSEAGRTSTTCVVSSSENLSRAYTDPLLLRNLMLYPNEDSKVFLSLEAAEQYIKYRKLVKFKALEKELGLPVVDVPVSKMVPEDFEGNCSMDIALKDGL